MEEEQRAADSRTRKAVLTKRKGKINPTIRTAGNIAVRYANRRPTAAAADFLAFINLSSNSAASASDSPNTSHEYVELHRIELKFQLQIQWIDEYISSYLTLGKLNWS